MKILKALLGYIPIPVLALLAGVPAQAITLYQSSVNTASSGIPSLIGSPTTTLNDFTSAASLLGSISVVTFEGSTNNFYPSGSGSVTVPAAVGSGNLTIQVNNGVPNTDVRSNAISNFSGTDNIPYGFNTTPGGTNLLRINNGISTRHSDTNTIFSFSSPIQAFGTYITDYGNTNNGILTPQITFVDGTTVNLTPVTRSRTNRGGLRSVLFYGFTAAPEDALISSVTFAHSDVTSRDRYGFDDIRFVIPSDSPSEPEKVPEPSLVLGTLVGGLCLLLKSKKES